MNDRANATENRTNRKPDPELVTLSLVFSELGLLRVTLHYLQLGKRKRQNTIPNTTAQHLSKMLETDFGSLREDPLLSVNIMQGAAGEFLTAQLYARLQESTLAIVLMTADIKDKSGTLYSKPNVYHELGYLMKHIGRDRVLLVCEEETMIPANVQDLIRVPFTRGKLALAYHEIVQWLNRTCSFGADVTIKALEQHAERLGSEGRRGRWARRAAVQKARM